MKQKCQIQIGTAQYKDAATVLRTSGIKALSNEVFIFVLAQRGSKVISHQISNV